MKTIKLSNGEIRKGYEFNDLSEEAQSKVLENQIQFEIEVMDEESPYYECQLEMERMLTPWFLGQEIYSEHKADLIDTIQVNGYLFDEEGEMLPVTYHMKKNNEVDFMTYGKKEYKAEFI